MPAARRERAKSGTPEAAAALPAARRWLLLVHQLPGTPSNLRVRTWRRLQELGAIALKQAVYALPDSSEAREDFEWLKVEIEGSGGEASVFTADNLNQAADAALVEAFRRARQTAYAELAADIQRAHRTLASTRAAKHPRPQGQRDALARYRQRLGAIERVDFFSSAGRDRVMALLTDLEAASPAHSASVEAPVRGEVLEKNRYRNRLWVTRPRPGVDRMGSAWLIRRFIDPHARFAFVTDAKAAPSDAVAFDMFGVGFGHEANRCTFETLQARFGIREPAVQRLATIVHDLDLKDDRFGAPEAATLGATIEGLQLSSSDDAALLEQGITLFEALYRSFAHATRQTGTKLAARRRSKPRAK